MKKPEFGKVKNARRKCTGKIIGREVEMGEFRKVSDTIGNSSIERVLWNTESMEVGKGREVKVVKRTFQTKTGKV